MKQLIALFVTLTYTALVHAQDFTQLEAFGKQVFTAYQQKDTIAIQACLVTMNDFVILLDDPTSMGVKKPLTESGKKAMSKAMEQQLPELKTALAKAVTEGFKGAHD